jgi:hypothetical protein
MRLIARSTRVLVLVLLTFVPAIASAHGAPVCCRGSRSHGSGSHSSRSYSSRSHSPRSYGHRSSPRTYRAPRSSTRSYAPHEALRVTSPARMSGPTARATTGRPGPRHAPEPTTPHGRTEATGRRGRQDLATHEGARTEQDDQEPLPAPDRPSPRLARTRGRSHRAARLRRSRFAGQHAVADHDGSESQGPRRAARMSLDDSV